jgi:hypothetical protein
VLKYLLDSLLAIQPPAADAELPTLATVACAVAAVAAVTFLVADTVALTAFPPIEHQHFNTFAIQRCLAPLPTVETDETDLLMVSIEPFARLSMAVNCFLCPSSSRIVCSEED